MEDASFSVVCSPLESLVYAPSTKVRDLFSQLANNKDFAMKIFSCRETLGLKQIFKTDILKRKTKFDDILNHLDREDLEEYYGMIQGILKEFNLPTNFLSTLSYLVGTGLIFNPAPPLLVNYDNNKLQIQIYERMTKTELIKNIKLSWPAIEEKMENLPRIVNKIHHKDGLRIGFLITYWKENKGLKNNEIADLLNEFEEDDYMLFGASKPISISDKDVETYYIRHKREKQKPLILQKNK